MKQRCTHYERIIRFVQERQSVTLEAFLKKYPEIPSGTYHSTLYTLNRHGLLEKNLKAKRKIAYQKTNQFTLERAISTLRTAHSRSNHSKTTKREELMHEAVKNIVDPTSSTHYVSDNVEDNMMSEKSSRFLNPIERLPRGKRRKESFYDEIIREFIYSGIKCAEVKQLGRKPLTVQIMLKMRVKRRKEAIKVLIRNKKVYLERSDDPGDDVPNLGKHYFERTIANSDSRIADSRIKPSADVITLLNTAIVKARCPKCGELNAKNSRNCKECGHDFYANEEEYRESLVSMEKLEKRA